MAYYTRKTGMELWKKGIFQDHDFCICCKSEVASGEEGYLSIKPSPRIIPDGPITRRKLCALCREQWVQVGGPLFKIPRFKLK